MSFASLTNEKEAVRALPTCCVVYAKPTVPGIAVTTVGELSRRTTTNWSAMAGARCSVTTPDRAAFRCGKKS